MKKWNWNLFGVIMIISWIGILGNENYTTFWEAELAATIIGLPLALTFAWMTKED